MKIEKKFSDAEFDDCTLGVTVWDKGLRGKVSFSAQGDYNEAFITVDIHEFKAWIDKAYTETFGQPETNASDQKGEK